MNQHIQQLRANLSARFHERREVIDGSLAAVLAGKHRTAKSALARAIAQTFGRVYFERLLTSSQRPRSSSARSVSRHWSRTASPA